MTNIHNIEMEELTKIAELYVHVFNSEPWNDEWTIETATGRLQDIHHTPNFVGLKYVDSDGEIKGAVLGNCEQWYKGKHFNLKEMFISTELQGKGIGSQLLNALEDRLKGFDVNSIILFTSKGDKIDEFYLKHGFSELDFMCMMDKRI